MYHLPKKLTPIRYQPKQEYTRKPEFSQLYLNEYCFFKNLKVFGVDALAKSRREKLGIVEVYYGSESERTEKAKNFDPTLKNEISKSEATNFVFHLAKSQNVRIVKDKLLPI
ncbi:hypothetical protein AB3N61_06535 [Leptospira sp. WS58.C1]|uniref:hypothetical protein n=1 Tax=Leptospira cinconiae TaxID=3235173 RepID=UPI00349EE7BC